MLTRLTTEEPLFRAGFLAIALLAAAVGVGVAQTPVKTATWTLETPDREGAGKSSSLRIDKSGNVDVAFVAEDGDRNPLRYATWDNKLKKWFVMTIAENVGSCSMVLDSKQNPHISYVGAGPAGGGKLGYTYWDGASWKKIPSLLGDTVVSSFSSLVLDAYDNPSITFYESHGPRDSDSRMRLRNVTSRNGRWEVKTVDGTEGSGLFNAMAIDPLGHVHIAYANLATETAGARYAYWDGAAWKTELIEGLPENNGQIVGVSSSITLDKAGNPHISYVNKTARLLKYAVKKNGRWQVQTIASLLGVGYPDRNSIALDDTEQPYISYFDAGRGMLMLAHHGPQGWVLEPVDKNNSGFTSSMQIQDNQIWISYADEANGVLKVAHRDLGESGTAESIGDIRLRPLGHPAAMAK